MKLKLLLPIAKSTVIDQLQAIIFVILSITLSISTFIPAVGQNPQLEWANRMGGNADDSRYYDYYNGIVSDSNGNVYVTGLFNDTVDFDERNPNVYVFISKTRNVGSSFVAKYDKDGNCLWVTMIGGEAGSMAAGRKIAIDAQGNLWVTGEFAGTVDFDRRNGGPTLASVAGSRDAFLAKFDPSGNCVWAQGIGNNGLDFGTSIAIDSDENIFITGAFQDTISFNSLGNPVQLIAKGISDGFVVKYNKTGDCLWARRIGGNHQSNLDEYCYGIAVDISGNAFVTGTFRDVVDFGNGSDTISSYGQSDGYLVKYDASGNYLWSISVGGSMQDHSHGIAVNKSGEAFITGYFMGVASFNPRQNTGILTGLSFTTTPFVAKYDGAGNYLWAINMNTTKMGSSGANIDLDDIGNVYATGTYVGTADFDPYNPGNFVHDNNDMNSFYGDVYLAKYSGNSGRCIWVKTMGSPNQDNGNDVEIDNFGNVFLTGTYKDDIDIDPGSDTLMLTRYGYGDGFLIKFSCEDTISTYLKVESCNDDYSLHGEIYTETGIYFQSFPSDFNCDSIITLDLTLYRMEKPVIRVEVFELSTVLEYNSYQWLKNGIAISGATQRSYIVTENADYQVVVYNEGECVDTSFIYTVTNSTNSINEESEIDQYIHIYPNPTLDVLYISSPIPIHANVLGIDGRTVLNVENAKAVSLKNLANGMYLIQITNNRGEVIKYDKVIKE